VYFKNRYNFTTDRLYCQVKIGNLVFQFFDIYLIEIKSIAMNRKVLSLVLAFVLATFASQAQINVFEDSLKNLLKQARHNNKEALVMVSATWCGPCKMFKKNMVPKPEMGKYVNSKFAKLVSENGETVIKGDGPVLLYQIQRRDAYALTIDALDTKFVQNCSTRSKGEMLTPPT